MDNYTDCKEIVTLVIIGEYLVELLPQEEGYFFGKNALKLCWKWIEEQEIKLGDLYDCLDSPEEIDFSYFEDMAENEKEEKYIDAYL